MPFEKGKPRHPNAGRRKGTPNERTKAEQACARAGIDPFDLLVKHAIGGDIGAVIQLCKHVEPPRKPLDVDLTSKEGLRIEVHDYTSIRKKDPTEQD